MLSWIEINKKNRILILTYLFIQSLLLISYFFMITLRSHGYQPELYRKTYIGFMSWGLFFFSVLLVLWEVDGIYIKNAFKNLISSVIFTFSSIPLIFIIFSIGQLHGINLFLPLIIQILWGFVILSVKSLLIMVKAQRWYSNYLLLMFMITVLILSMVFLLLYIQYAQLVITTIYDKDIPLFFFINPVLSLTGLSYAQMGGDTQMNYLPISFFGVFWTTIVVIVNIMAYRLSRRRSL